MDDISDLCVEDGSSRAEVPWRRRVRQGTKIVLGMGFGGLLALLVFLGLNGVQALNRVRKAESESSQTYLVRHERLESVRAAAYALSSQVRNYLVDPDGDSYTRHRMPALADKKRAESALLKYKQVASTDRLTLVEKLTADLRAFWSVADQSFEWTDQKRQKSGYDLLARQIGPLRDQFLSTLDEIRLGDQEDLKNSVRDTAEFLDSLQQKLWLTLGLTLLLGMGLAAASLLRLVRLEREANARYQESLRTAAQLEQLSRRLLNVQEEERRRLARELHDEVGQSVGAMLVELGQARTAIGPSSQEAEARLRSAAELGEQTMRNLRDLCLLLRPAMLDDLGLIPALHWQARETARRSHIDVRFHSDEEELELSDEVRTAVYRVIQEALQNTEKHSQAKSVNVALLRNGEHLRILVEDDGVGFDPAVTRGMGLLGMQERIIQLGGSLRINSSPRKGTVLTIDVPLKAAWEARQEATRA